MEGGYQLPDSGPPRQRGWFSRRKYGGRKRANQRQRERCTLEQARGLSNCALPGLTHSALALPWPGKVLGKSWPIVNSKMVSPLTGCTPHVTLGFIQTPTAYTVSTFQGVDRNVSLRNVCPVRPLHSLNAELLFLKLNKKFTVIGPFLFNSL